MKIELQKWSFEDKETLITICNSIDRSYLAGRIPDPYTEESADWWLNMVGEIYNLCMYGKLEGDRANG